MTNPTLDLLAAGGPHPDHADAVMLYGRLVGSWTIDARQVDDDGTETRRRGEWHFAWVLGGLAVQDVIFVAGAPADERGSTLRCYDTETGTWHVVFMSPFDREFAFLTGRGEGGDIVQEGPDPRGRGLARWSFVDIRDATFTWRGERSEDGGATWRLTHEMHAFRAQRPS
jgi:hypothetical protein